MAKGNLIQERSFKFALNIIQLYSQMTEKKEFILSKQLLRSGTSIGANVEEAIGGQSKKDFLSKMNIALKETRETNYWLRLIKESNLVDVNCNATLRESQEICNIISAIVKTTRETV